MVNNEKGRKDAGVNNIVEMYNDAEWNKKGIKAGAIGNYIFAVDAFSKSIELNPEEACSYSNRGDVYDDLGQHQSAIEDFNEAIRLMPDIAGIYILRGASYGYLGQHQRAIEDCNEAPRLQPDDKSAYYEKACLFALQKNAAQTCNWLRLAIERGYKDWKHIKEDKDFDTIRNESCFIDLLKESEK